MDTALNTTAGHPIHEIRAADGVLVAAPPHRGVKLTIAVFALCFVALFVAAVAISVAFTEADGIHLWAMVLMGAVIIAILLGGVFLPFAKEIRKPH